MVKHLVNLLFVNGVFVFLVHKRSNSKAEYNIKLIRQQTNNIKFSAAVIGTWSTVTAILIVMAFHQDLMIVIAAIFISLGTGRQLFGSALDVVTTNLNTFLSSEASTLLLLAKNRQTETTTDWSVVESQVKLIMTSIRSYNLPAELYGVNPESDHLIDYLNKHKLELEYQRPITHDNSSCLEFAQFAIKHMIQKLLIFAELEEFHYSLSTKLEEMSKTKS